MRKIDPINNSTRWQNYVWNHKDIELSFNVRLRRHGHKRENKQLGNN